jgi:hypothetical protein
LFLKIYEETKGRCEVTGQWQPFNPKNFAHLIAKGSRPDLRLVRENVAHVLFDIHYAYDSLGKEALLEQYPEAQLMYDRKEKLKEWQP